MQALLVYSLIILAVSYSAVAFSSGGRGVLQTGSNLTKNSFLQRRPLQLDVFGLGPAEALVIVGCGALLFGPGRVREQLKKGGVKGKIVSDGWYKERKERIEEMTKLATKRRVSRQLQFINEAIENNDEYVLERMGEYDEMNGKDI